MAHWAQYIALRGVAGFMQCFDVDQNLHSAGAFGSLYARVSAKRRRRAEHNIAMSFPDWDADRVEAVAEASIRHMFQVFAVDAITMPRLVTKSSWQDYAHFANQERILELLLLGRPAIFLTGHCGNWELLGFTLAVLGFPLHALARPLDNPLINRWLLDVREARGMRVITKWGATPVLQELLDAGSQIAFIADQNAGEQGLFVPFFGRLASSYKSIALLAMRHDVPIVAGHAKRLDGRFRYELGVTDVIEPEDWRDQPDPLFYITARYNRAMEEMIRAAPEQYLWVHRRWKSRPRHERQGKPIPRRLVEKIRALPWMTDDELGRIIEHADRVAAGDAKPPPL